MHVFEKQHFVFLEDALSSRLNIMENPEKTKVLSRQYCFGNDLRNYTFLCVSIKNTPTVLHQEFRLIL